MVDANRPEIGFVFDVDDRASRQLDRIADQMERIDRAQRGIAGGAGRVGGAGLADQYRDAPQGGAAGGQASGGAGYGQQVWSDNPEVRRLQQEEDARNRAYRQSYAALGGDSYLGQTARSTAYNDQDFERDAIRHRENLRRNAEQIRRNEEDYAQRKLERTKEWEDREEARHKNQIDRDRKRVLEFEDSQKRLRGHMYGSNFAGEFLAELGFVIFEQFQQGTQAYAAQVDAEGFEFSGAGGELAGARRFQSRFGDFQTLLGEGVVGAGGILEDVFGPLFESGETTSTREFVEGIGRTREELERIAGIPRTDGMSALSALLQQIDKDKLDPGALGAAVDELQRLGTLGLGQGAGADGFSRAAHGIIGGGLNQLSALSDSMRWGHLIQRNDYEQERLRIAHQLQRATDTPDSEFEQFIRQQQLAVHSSTPTPSTTMFDASQSDNLDRYLEQVQNIAEAMQEAGILSDQWQGGTIALHDAIVEATDDVELADRVIWEYTKAQEANNQRLIDNTKTVNEATREYDLLTKGFEQGRDEIRDLDYAMKQFEETAGNTRGLEDHTHASQRYREEIELITMAMDAIPVSEYDIKFETYMNDGKIDADELADLISEDYAKALRDFPTQIDTVINIRVNQVQDIQRAAYDQQAIRQANTMLGPEAATLYGMFGGMATGDQARQLVKDTNTGRAQAMKQASASRGGGGSPKKTPEQAWIEERIKLLQDGATVTEVDALEMAFYADYANKDKPWAKDYDQPGHLTAFGYGVKKINDRIQAAEDQADMNEKGYDALSDIDKQIRDLRIKGEANKGMLEDFDSYESYQAQIEQLEKQKEILEEHLEQGTLTSETLANIEEQSEYWAERNQEALERMTDKVDEMKEELKKKFDETIQALSISKATELAGTGAAKPPGVSDEVWHAAEKRNALQVQLAFAQASLAEAEQFGDPAEIAKQKRRLENIQKGLSEAEQQLTEARSRAEREGMSTNEIVREGLGDQVGDSSSEGYVSWTDPKTGEVFHLNPTAAYIKSRGIDDLNSEEAIAIRRGINTRSAVDGADFNLGDSADASAEEALQYWTQSQSGSAPSGDSASTTQVTINLGDGTTIQSSTAEVIVEEQG